MNAFVRGDVVACGRQRAVVWLVGAERFILLPVENFGPRFAGDVPLEAAADKITFRKPHAAVIRTSRARCVPMARQVRVGRVSDWLLAELIPAARRSAQSAAWCAIWEAGERHRRRGLEERCALR